MNDLTQQQYYQATLARQQNQLAGTGLASQQSLMNSLLGSGMAAYTLAQAQPFTPVVEPMGDVLRRFNGAVDALDEVRRKIRMVRLRGNL